MYCYGNLNHYCVDTLESAYETYLCRLITLQNKLTKLVAGVSPRTNADVLYVQLNILTIQICMLDMWDSFSMHIVMICDLNCLLMFNPVCNIHNCRIGNAAEQHLRVVFEARTSRQKCISTRGLMHGI